MRRVELSLPLSGAEPLVRGNIGVFVSGLRAINLQRPLICSLPGIYDRR
jgi:hypothetical protein